MNNATINVVCYKWKTLANGENPLMLRVCKDGKAKYQSLGISVNSKHWNFKKNELEKPQLFAPPRASFIDPLRQKMIDPLRQNKNDP